MLDEGTASLCQSVLSLGDGEWYCAGAGIGIARGRTCLGEMGLSELWIVGGLIVGNLAAETRSMGSWDLEEEEEEEKEGSFLAGLSGFVLLMGVTLYRNKMQWARILVLATSRVVPALPFFGEEKNSRQKRGGLFGMPN